MSEKMPHPTNPTLPKGFMSDGRHMQWAFDGEFTWLYVDDQGKVFAYVFDKSTDRPGGTGPYEAATPIEGQEHKGHLNVQSMGTFPTADAAKDAVEEAI